MFIKDSSLISDFKKLLARGRLGHAYLFWGDSNAIEKFGEQILALTDQGQKIYIDGKIVGVEGKTIGIDEVREIIQFLYSKPLRASHKTVLINQADRLSLEAQNALLKILEEPPGHALIIMSVRDKGVLIEALLSRMQCMYMPYNDEAPSAEYMNIAARLLRGGPAERKAAIAKLIEDEIALESVVHALLVEYRKDPVKNNALMKSITMRWAKMSQYNTNKKLQLEAMFIEPNRG